MATLAETLLANAPPATVTIPTSAWATGFIGRPKVPVMVGLRRLADDDFEAARAVASKKAHRDFACRECGAVTNRVGQVHAFNDTLLTVAVGRGTCLPNDIHVAYFDREEDDVRTRMTPEGARFVWDAIERLHLMDSPVTAAASDDDLLTLGISLAAPSALAGLPPAMALRARKLATFLLAELRAFPTPDT